jgi:biopolymer transport protein ExbD
VAEQLSAAQRSKVRRLSAPKEVGPDETGGELNIVPFLDIITNVLMFVLATVTVTFTATIDTYPPRAGSGARAPTTPTLGLTVLVVPDGFSIKASGGNVAPGCNDRGPGIAIPKKDADYDYEGLKNCVTRLKSDNSAFRDEMGVTISANPPIPYQVVIGTMDAVRRCNLSESNCQKLKNDETPANATDIDLFPDVSFGVAR